MAAGDCSSGSAERRPRVGGAFSAVRVLPKRRVLEHTARVAAPGKALSFMPFLRTFNCLSLSFTVNFAALQLSLSLSFAALLRSFRCNSLFFYCLCRRLPVQTSRSRWDTATTAAVTATAATTTAAVLRLCHYTAMPLSTVPLRRQFANTL